MPRTLGQAIGFLLGFWIAIWLSPLRVNAEPTASSAFSPLEEALHREVNVERAGRHLIPLRRLPALDAVALAHSRDMVKRRYLAHESPEGWNALDRLSQARVAGFSLAAENIGTTNRQQPNREILRAWIQSPIHSQNLYSPPFNATGIGIARAADGSLIYTQVYVTYPR